MTSSTLSALTLQSSGGGRRSLARSFLSLGLLCGLVLGFGDAGCLLLLDVLRDELLVLGSLLL